MLKKMTKKSSIKYRKQHKIDTFDALSVELNYKLINIPTYERRGDRGGVILEKRGSGEVWGRGRTKNQKFSTLSSKLSKSKNKRAPRGGHSAQNLWSKLP